jgi:hypothetical protein
MFEFIANIHNELLTLVIGVTGGIVGFLVSDGNGWRLLVASAFVGGFVALTFPPIIIVSIEATGVIVAPEVSRSITGTISAVSWQLVISLKGAVPNIIEKYTDLK